MKISKEKARESLMDMVGNIFHAKKITNLGIELAFDGRTYGEAKSAINSAFDNLTVDHPKVVLPREVGEELEDWLATDNIDDILDDLVCVYDVHHEAVRDWWVSTLGATYLIADMARYGWEADKESLYKVKVPLVQAQGGLWFYINSEDKLGATYLQKMAKKFTMDEIERYGLQGCEKEEVTDHE